MFSSRHADLADYLMKERAGAISLFTQLHEQYRAFVVHPLDKRGRRTLHKWKDGIVFSESPEANVSLRLRVPNSVSVMFHEKDGDEQIEIPFKDIVVALQECEDKAVNDNRWHVAFDKQVLRVATAALKSRDPKQVYEAAKQIEEQVERLARSVESLKKTITQLKSELTESDKQLLTAMHKLNCYDNESKKTTPHIVQSISTRLDYNSSFKRSGASLQKTNPPLIQKGAKGHGYWLTPAGIEVCKLLAPEK